jgi:hypothetical protein
MVKRREEKRRIVRRLKGNWRGKQRKESCGV